MKVEEKMLRKQNERNRGKVQQEVEELPDQDFSTLRVKQEVQVVDRHKEENLVEEYLHPEEEVEEDIFGVIHVENGDMCHGTVLIINQQVRGIQMWLRQSQTTSTYGKGRIP